MLFYFFIIVCAVFKATADTLLHHFDTSIFKYEDPAFWNPTVSWEYVPYIKFTKYRPDAWHLSNSLMLLCGALAAVSNQHLVSGIVDLGISGTLFILTFNLFYNKIFRRKFNP